MRQRDALSAILGTCHLRNDLGRDIAGNGKRVRPVDPCPADHRSVLQHVLQIDQITVVHMLRKIIRIMEMDDPLFVRLHNITRQ